jgi:choline kinase
MRYLILSAGQGTRMTPFAKATPKALLQLGFGETVASRMVRIIRKVDPNAHIAYVLGFQHDEIEKILPHDVEVVINPFYTVSNSIASMWFARHLLDQETTMINGDIVISEAALRSVTAQNHPATVVLDSSRKNDLDCGVIVEGDRVVLMSKSFQNAYGEYAGILRLDQAVTGLLRKQVEEMIEANDLDNWPEYALMQLILTKDLDVRFHDLSGHDWAELDTLPDLCLARAVQQREFICGN